MSGRLRILPHKSWHVWTTENIDKVKRDERIHKEEIENLSKKSRDIKSEQLLSQLLHQNISNDQLKESDVISDTDEEEVIKSKYSQKKRQKLDNNEELKEENHSILPIKEMKINRQSDNPEYKKEKIDKEIQQKRQEGSAPFQLVPDEFTSKNAPWYLSKKGHVKVGSGYLDYQDDSLYEKDKLDLEKEREKHSVLTSLMQPSASLSLSKQIGSADNTNRVIVRGQRLEGQAAAAFHRRDSSRKGKADPMADFLNKPSITNADTTSSLVDYEKKNIVLMDQPKRIKSSIYDRPKDTSDVEDDSDRRHSKKAHKHNSKRKHKKEKKRKNLSSTSEPATRAICDATTLQMLRQKRLERERDAQLKTSLHMAQR